MTKNTAPTAPYDYTKVRTVVSDKDIAQAAYNAGFRGEALVTAVAVALGESHGNTTALNDNKPDFSVGLWQINVNGYLAARLKRWGLSSWTDLYDPETNAKAAYSISGGGKNFSAWSVYNHRQNSPVHWAANLERANAAAKQVDPNAPTVPLPPIGQEGSDSPNKDSATAFLNWWDQNPLSRQPLATWETILSDYGASTGDSATVEYLKGVLSSLGIDLGQPIGVNEPGSGLEKIMAVLTADAGPRQSLDMFANLWQGFFNGLGNIIPSIEHGFYFLIFIIIGLVILVVGFKARSTGTSVGEAA